MVKTKIFEQIVSRLAVAIIATVAFSSTWAASSPTGIRMEILENHPIVTARSGRADLTGIPTIGNPDALLSIVNEKPADHVVGRSIDFYGPIKIQFAKDSVEITNLSISNTSATYTSGPLRLELWALPSFYNGGSLIGYIMFSTRTNGLGADTLSPGSSLGFSSLTTGYTFPGDASFDKYALILEENSAGCASSDHWCAIAWFNFNQTQQNCSASSTTACLQGGRFQLEVGFTDYDGESGPANLMRFNGTTAANDESSFWTFQTPDNYEFGFKVLSRCAHGYPGNYFQVMISALTDLGWFATLTDTQNGLSWVFTNPNSGGGIIPPAFNNDHLEDCP